MNLPSDVYSDCLHSLVNGHTVFWSVHGLLVISMRTSHRGLDVSKRKRWAGKSRMVLVNSPAEAMLLAADSCVQRFVGFAPKI